MNKTYWECQKCGAQSPKWAGKCPECGTWSSLVETVNSGGPAANSRTRMQAGKQAGGHTKPQKLSEILKTSNSEQQRVSTGVGELDRVLGSGLVPGAVVLLAGEPGMGKSTLLSQVALKLAEKRVLYVCGEESPSQVAIRLQRLLGSSEPSSTFSHARRHSTHPSPPLADQGSGVALRRQQSRILQKSISDSLDQVILFSETDVDIIAAQMEQVKPSLVIIDSIQTMFTNDLSGMAGAVGQIRECAGRLSQVAKALNIPLFLVGHVTKEGDVAGPKVLEHVVDVVLVLEGDRSGALRIVRAVKNRFGPVDEVGLFSMDEGGMQEVLNPAELLIGDFAGQAAGSVLGCVLEGQRPLVLEIQALTVPSKIPVPRRIGHGINERRLQLLCAVVEKHIDSRIGEKDVFVNVAGGIKSQDPGLDLAIIAAIVSSLVQKTRNTQVVGKSGSQMIRRSDARQSDSPNFRQSGSLSILSVPIFCGEVGLLGEVRQVIGWERRVKEVGRLQLGSLVGRNQIQHIRELQKYL